MHNRKNALFAGSDEGGDNWAVIATLIENCKISGVNPHTWLAGTLAKLANGHPANAAGELMPWIAVARAHRFWYSRAERPITNGRAFAPVRIVSAAAQSCCLQPETGVR